jgi:hypothetical protein
MRSKNERHNNIDPFLKEKKITLKIIIIKIGKKKIEEDIQNKFLLKRKERKKDGISKTTCTEVEKALICRQLEKGRPGDMELLHWRIQGMGKCVSFFL